MALSSAVQQFLKDASQRIGVGELAAHDDLFETGVLDSFSLVDLVAVIEQDTGLKVPDSDVNPINFQTIEQIQRYVESRKS